MANGVRRRIADRVDALYERRFDVDTSGVLALAEHHEDSKPYEPVRWPGISRMLDEAPLGPDDVVIDAGCGKGRVVLCAALNEPVKRVIGFDISAELIDVAKQNVENVRDRLSCQNVDLFVADAISWEIPDDVTWIVLNNCFSGPVLDGFLAQINASYQRAPRELHLLYIWPWYKDVLAETGWFEPLWSRGQGLVSPPTRLYKFTG